MKPVPEPAGIAVAALIELPASVPVPMSFCVGADTGPI
jgi:hypothetical protein